MPEESLVDFQYVGNADIPDHDPTVAPPVIEMPVPNTGIVFDRPDQNAQNGIPMFEMVARRRANGKFENVEFVSIITPGDTKSIPRHKVTDYHRNRYRPYYERWKRGLETSPTGTPLEMWPIMTPAQVHQLKAVNIFTVEQLVNVPDTHIHQLPMGETLRKQAKDWLESKEKADLLAQRTAELDTMRDGQRLLENQLAAMSEKMEQLQAKLDARDGASPKTDDEARAKITDDESAVPAPDSKPPPTPSRKGK